MNPDFGGCYFGDKTDLEFWDDHFLWEKRTLSYNQTITVSLLSTLNVVLSQNHGSGVKSLVLYCICTTHIH